MSLITDFITEVRTQNTNQPNHPKYTKFTLPFSFPYTTAQAISYIINENFTYLSVVSINSELYWEFYNTATQDDFTRFRFLYVLINYANFNSLKNRLPFYYSYDKLDIHLQYPKKEYLIDANSESWGTYYLVRLFDLYSHPFLPTFYFSGRVCVIKDRLLYEYLDDKGFYSVKGFTYLSPLRPTNLAFPLDEAFSNLAPDPCYTINNTAYPSSADSYTIGIYTGSYTTSRYSKHIKFWTYRSDDLGDFLLDSPPSYVNYSLVQTVINSLNPPVIKLPTISGESSIIINQNSTQVVINT